MLDTDLLRYANFLVSMGVRRGDRRLGRAGDGERSPAEADTFPADFDPVDTSSEDPAMLVYTSGSTGHPKGVLHAHRIIEGYLLTFKLFFNVSFDESTVFYTPSDWAWVGGLLDILLPPWCSVTSTRRPYW